MGGELLLAPVLRCISQKQFAMACLKLMPPCRRSQQRQQKQKVAVAHRQRKQLPHSSRCTLSLGTMLLAGAPTVDLQKIVTDTCASSASISSHQLHQLPVHLHIRLVQRGHAGILDLPDNIRVSDSFKANKANEGCAWSSTVFWVCREIDTSVSDKFYNHPHNLF
mmetsp:Transcript_2031/g.3736  ORF Transcript_2031/g.3736 Transcript_2031/m.3736 type:complete len:165 (-) Transcript_2031:815-1309(-)